MKNIVLDLAKGEVWLEVRVTPATTDKDPRPCHWVFNMDLTATRNVTKDIPPIQDGPAQRPLAAPGALIGSTAAWNLLINNLDKNPHTYDAVVRIYQVAPGGQETDVYVFKKKVEFDPSTTAEAKPNPRNLSEGLKFVL
ncbi:hypothetical protein [Hymenobacter rubripertinctus]|uniref:Uncharacterized protein n=1 Tax=Hymenobacter rubripertinctus TaxID=2029981 RepID=A0A418QRU6_9BACT|nr:hypothetical protein [Hymenobacter rubripertinctus]RIY07821.1 hypothetical protein D0T11_15710 [Hymenobacter rubripertinctus]